MADLVVGVVRDCRERRARPGRGSTPTARCITPIGPCRARRRWSSPARRLIRRRRRATARRRARRQAASGTARAVSKHRDREPGGAGNALEHRHARCTVQVRFQPALLPGHRYDVLARRPAPQPQHDERRVSRCRTCSAARTRCRSSSSMRRARKSCARRREPSSFSKRACRIRTREPAAATSRR